MSELNLDVFGHILTYAALGTVNALARSCSQLAGLVRGRANDIADEHARLMVQTGRSVLPNGTLHGIVTETVSHGRVVVDYVRGVPTHWCHNTDEDEVAWGCNGFPYVICCPGAEYVSCAWATVTFDNVSIIARVDGEVIFTVHGHTTYEPTWREAVRGYLVDGHIATDVVGAWVSRIIDRIEKATGVIVIGPPDVYVVHVTGSADVIRDIDSLRVVKT